MTDTWWANFMTMLPPLIVALGALIAAVATLWRTVQLEKSVNGRLSQLMTAREGQSFTAGAEAERKDPGAPVRPNQGAGPDPVPPIGS